MHKRDWIKRKDALKSKRYKNAVLDAFDGLERTEKRDQLFEKMEVEIEGKRKL